MALGYLLGKTSAKLSGSSPNIPTMLTLSVISDIDILAHAVIEHRGPTHSIFVALLIFLPFFIAYRGKSLPYFLAFISHSMIGDSLSGQIQLFWPLTTANFGLGITIRNPVSIALEWMLFLISLAVMFRAKDIAHILQPNNSNLILAIPTFTVLLPTLLGYPLGVPSSLVVPHLIYLFLFLASMLAGIIRKTPRLERVSD